MRDETEDWPPNSTGPASRKPGIPWSEASETPSMLGRCRAISLRASLPQRSRTEHFQHRPGMAIYHPPPDAAHARQPPETPACRCTNIKPPKTAPPSSCSGPPHKPTHPSSTPKAKTELSFAASPPSPPVATPEPAPADRQPLPADAARAERTKAPAPPNAESPPAWFDSSGTTGAGTTSAGTTGGGTWQSARSC